MKNFPNGEGYLRAEKNLKMTPEDLVWSIDINQAKFQQFGQEPKLKIRNLISGRGYVHSVQPE